MPDERSVRLKLDAPRSGTVAETAEYLTSLESCYRHLAVFHAWADEVEEGEWRHWFPFPVPWYPAILPDVIGESEVPLRVSAVQLQSPGFWEFLGSLNPLETLRKYLGDRHERRKDRQWRESLEAEKLRLENEQLRTQVVGARVELLRKAGVPRSIIRRALVAHVVLPLETLDRFQDSGLIGGVLPEAGSGPPPPEFDPPRRMIRLRDDDEPKKDT